MAYHALSLTVQIEPKGLNFLPAAVLLVESCTNLACEYIDQEIPWRLVNLCLRTSHKAYCGL